MATLVRIRRTGRTGLRIGKVNVSNLDYGSVIDLDDPFVRRDLKNTSSARYVFVENKPITTAGATKRAIENMNVLDAVTNIAATSTKTQFTAVEIPPGETVVSIGYVTGATAGGTSTHRYVYLSKVVGTNLVAVAVSADDVTATGGMAASSLITTTVFTTGTTQYVSEPNTKYYVGFAQVATQMPTLAGITLGSTALNGLGTTSLLAASEATAVRGAPFAVGAGAGTVAIADLTNALTQVPYVRVTTLL